MIEVYTDGSCHKDRGGWAAIIIDDDNIEHELSGWEKPLNNRMELLAVMKALQWIKEPSQVHVYSDSKYVINGITKWINYWKKHNWRTMSGKFVEHVDLWIQLDQIKNRHKVTWHWIKGHSGHGLNTRADILARKAASH
jgi:ribonuclease HI